MYNVDTGRVETVEFLRLNTINSYNEEMGNVDVADQLRGSYRCDIGVRNREWWWSLWFWALGVMLVNSYIMYLKLHLIHGRQKKDLISHHDFRRAIAIYWINEEYSKRTRVSEGTIVIGWKCKKSQGSRGESSTVSTLTQDTITKKKKACAVTDSSLCPERGALKTRLNSALDHIPDEAKPNARCGLHRWLNVETQKAISYCIGCNVNLCHQCYRYVYKTHDIVACKLALTTKYYKMHKKHKN